jgi:carboxymethylenebutenolidase
MTSGKLSRREFLAGSAAAGFALAARPISAAAVLTDAAGLDAGEVSIRSGDTDVRGYRAAPEGKGPFPVVAVVHEIFGVHEYIRDVCRRLAKKGYLAVAPDLYGRQGDVTKLSEREQIFAVVSRVSDAQVFADLDATLSWASAAANGDPARTAITGFCWGGRIVWLYAARKPSLRAGAAWYGRLATPPTELQPGQPIEVAASLTVPILGLYGGADAGIPLESVERMRAALARGKSGADIIVYADAPHAFHADYRDSYRPAAAEDGWKRMLEWFARHGV